MDRRNKSGNTNIYTKEQIERVIEGSGLNIESQVGSEFIVFCPFHNNHRTPAGEVNMNTGMFFCFSCNKIADLVEFVMHATNRTYFESIRFIKDKEQNMDIEKQINKKLFVKPDFVQFDELIIKRLNNQALESSRAMDYYTKRKVTKESILKFSLGYSEKQDMVTIPVHSPDGMMIGFVGRSIDGKEFKNTPGMPKSKTLFNLNRVKAANKVYVVESSFDVIRLDQVGFPAVATLGATISSQQVELLKKYFNDIIVIADNDEAGNNMKDRLVEKLGSRVSVIKLEKQYKDIGDMDDKSIKKLEFRFDNSIIAMLK
jgi:DNA primase